MDISKIDENFSKKVKEYSGELGVAYRDIQLLIFPNEKSNQIEFNLYKNKEFIKKLRLQEDILEIKIDFLAKAPTAQMLLNLILGAFAEELKCDKGDISVMIVARSNEDATACLALQKKGDFVRWIDVKSELSM